MARIDRTALARRVKARRLELGLTQREVAGEDFTRGFISQVENGLIDPSLKSLEIIAQRLGAPVGHFLGEADAVDPVAVETSIRRAHELLHQDPTQAIESARSALEGAEELGDPGLIARAQAAVAWAAYYGDDLAEAALRFRLAAEAYRLSGNHIQTVRCLNAAGSAAHRIGNDEEAASNYAAALDLVVDLEEPAINDQLRIMVNLGLLLTDLQESVKAIAQLHRALNFSAEHREYYRYGEVHNALGVNYRRLGEFDEAMVHYREAIAFHKAVHEDSQAAQAMLNCGNALAVQGAHQEARGVISEALQIYQELGDEKNEATARAELARLAWLQGNIELAEELCDDALQELTDKELRGRLLVLRGRICEHKGDVEAATEAYTNGLALLEDSERDPELAEACYEFGQLLLNLGRSAEASTYLIRAAASYRDLSR